MMSGWIGAASIGVVLMGGASAANSEMQPPARFEVDHIFFFAKPFAPEMLAFELAGFNRWPFTNSHSDQGTRGRYIYFDNVYIEFLWVDDEDVARANAARATTDMTVRATWRENPSVSPFGIGLRDLAYDEPPPVTAHVYKADWMGPEEGDFLGVFTPPDRAVEPWMFRMPPHWTKPAREELGPQSSRNLEHPNGARVLTAVEFTVNEPEPLSEALESLARDGAFSIVRGPEPLARLTFDGGVQGKTVDFRPETPIIIHY